MLPVTSDLRRTKKQMAAEQTLPLLGCRTHRKYRMCVINQVSVGDRFSYTM